MSSVSKSGKNERTRDKMTWKRTIGINIVTNLDKASEGGGLIKPNDYNEKFMYNSSSILIG
jgi:hypothetical protein